MANLPLVATWVFFLASSFIPLCLAREVPFESSLNDIPRFQHVCEPSRFKLHGLNMADFGYCNSSLPFEVRVKDLVGRMILAEKVQQLGDISGGVSRLGLPAYNWWSEILHGVSDVGHGTFFDELVPGATSFACPINAAAAFNRTLWKRIGQVVSTEGRAMFNLGRSGLTFWSPNVNVVRDPRWGRTLETPGEDPYTVGIYSVDFVRGLQDVEGFENASDPNARPLKVSACCKHYTAYDLDFWLGIDRRHFDAKVTEQDMMETFNRPFEMCVRDGDASSLMCSFNNINGIPPCADPHLLKEKVRGEWDLHGYIVSDCDSLQVIVENQKWLGDTAEDAVAQTIKAGLDLDCGFYYNASLYNSVLQGKVSEADLDKSLKYLYTVLMRVGFFDGSPQYKSLGKHDICSKEHIELALDGARQGIVLLKNDFGTLPLDVSKFKSFALIGPHANGTTVMIGNYAGVPCKYTSPLDAFSKVGKVTYELGCADVACTNDSLIFPAMKAAKNADATIIVTGIDLSVEREEVDRSHLYLPGFQTQMILRVAAAAKGPVILVIMSGGVLDISFAQDNPKIQGILWAGYPGEEGGQAIADVVFGKYNPGGRTPLTWYKAEYTDQLPMTSMQLRPVQSLGYPGRTYRFFDGPTVYPFGYGLSYTTFKYQLEPTTNPINIKLQKNLQHCQFVNYTSEAIKQPCPAALVDDLACKEQVTFNLVVKNEGKMDGNEVVLVYAKAPEGIHGTAIKELVGFERVFVPAGKSQTVSFALEVCKSLNMVDEKGYNLLPSGTHTIIVGDGAASFPVDVNLSS